ncbi:MAG: hypothetical protein ACWGSQ_06570 [Longimicrobiales bacterium]
MDEGIIDIQKFLNPPFVEGGRAFSVWGGEGERARFALPVWRAVFLMGGNRGGIFQVAVGRPDSCTPFFILDLKQDPARTTFFPPPAALLAQSEAPALSARAGGGILVFLGEERGRKWFLEVEGGEDRILAAGKRREELLFLAGECAGLLFFREFAGDPK